MIKTARSLKSERSRVVVYQVHSWYANISKVLVTFDFDGTLELYDALAHDLEHEAHELGQGGGVWPEATDDACAYEEAAVQDLTKCGRGKQSESRDVKRGPEDRYDLAKADLMIRGYNKLKEKIPAYVAEGTRQTAQTQWALWLDKLGTALKSLSKVARVGVLSASWEPIGSLARRGRST